MAIDASRTGSSGAWPRPRIRSRAATGTTTGGRGSTPRTRPCEEPSGDACDQLLPLPRGHRAPARARLRRLPVLARVVAHRARGRRVLDRGARPLPADARGLPRDRACCRSSRSTTSRRPAGWRRAGGWANPATVDRFAAFCERCVGASRRPDRRWRARSTSPTSCRCMGYAHGRVPARGEHGPRRLGGRERHICGPRTARRTTRSRRGRATSRSARPSRWATGGRPRSGAEHLHRAVPGRCTRTSTSRPPGATTSSACRRTRGPGSARRAAGGPRGGRRGRADGLRVLAPGAGGGDPPRGRGDRHPGVRDRERHRHRRRRAAGPVRAEALGGRGPHASTTGSTCGATSTGRCSTTSSGPFGYRTAVRAGRGRPGHLRPAR